MLFLTPANREGSSFLINLCIIYWAWLQFMRTAFHSTMYVTFCLYILCFLPPAAVMGIKDQGKTEDCVSVCRKVQTNCGPVLPPVHSRQLGEGVVRRSKKGRDRKVEVENETNEMRERDCILIPSNKINFYNLVLSVFCQAKIAMKLSILVI